MKSSIKNIVCLAVTCLAIAIQAHAFPTSKYASQSALRSGRWVKISVPENGMYEITAEELSAMGFNDINKVQVYGLGGHPINEKLTGEVPDDLYPIPTGIYTTTKIYFYGAGPVKMSMNQRSSDMPFFQRTYNSYSTQGYYFLHESNTVVRPERGNQGTAFTNMRSTSYDYYYHENELSSVGYTGRQLLGEDITLSPITLDYQLNNLASNSIVVNVCAAAQIREDSAWVQASVLSNGATMELPFTTRQSGIPSSNSEYSHYNIANPAARLTSDDIKSTGQLQVGLQYFGNRLNTAKLDFFIITFEHSNKIGTNPYYQFRVWYPSIAADDRIDIPGGSSALQVWEVSDPLNPKRYVTSATTGADGAAARSFIPGERTTPSQFMVFNPKHPMRKINSGFQEIENQNIHGLPTPDMVIVTCPAFHEQAQRVANLHSEHEGLTVHVLNQEDIFNEFSGGTPDAMAIRLMCKMFYDRNPSKFKYLLMFGHGSFDNRGLVSVKPNRVITYESDNSSDENNSYVTDDFFGFLDDYSGETLSSDVQRLGIGRITSASVTEAESDVDKLYDYVLNPDYGSWRNAAMMSAETGDDNLHIYQCENTFMLMNDKEQLNTQFNFEKAYIDMFPRAVNEQWEADENNRTSLEARRHMNEVLNRGVYFYSYIGHAGASTLTRSGLWDSHMVNTVSYPHLPIMTLACCDVGRFDSSTRGITEHMVHKRDGGAIAVLTASRQVYADSNDALNRAFISALFSYGSTGQMTTLGDAFRQAKQSFKTANQNKLKFHLFGDPAMKVNYPKPLFKITKINGHNVTENDTVAVLPMRRITFEAQVMKADGVTLDNTFTGDATVSLYDVERKFRNITYHKNTINTYYPRELLAEINGRVVNGIFTGSIIVPRYEKAKYELIRMSVYAHKDGTDQMVNGKHEHLRMSLYNNGNAIHDVENPVINDMFINDKSTFSEEAFVPSNSTLYISATDDIAFNIQSMSVGNAMTLQLDGGQSSFYLIKNYANVSDEGRQLNIAYPLTGLSSGRHTLRFTVYDLSGNSASREITFVVGQSSSLLIKSDRKATSTNATFDIMRSTLNTSPEVTLKVTDAQGNLVWTTTTSTFPCTWDLKNKQGQRVPAGLYKYYGTYVAGDQYGGTDIDNLIVIDPLPEQ